MRFSDIIFIWLGIVVWELSKFVYRRLYLRKRGYRWKCPQCNFRVKTDSYETYYISVNSHNHASTKEYKRNG